MFWILLCIGVFLAILSEIHFRWKYRSLNRFPGPLDLPFIGMYFYFVNKRTLLQNMFRLEKSYGDIARGRIGQQVFLQITNPEMLEFFLKSPKFTAKSDNYLFLIPWLGNGTFVGEGTVWLNGRKMAQTAFHKDIMEDNVTVFKHQSDVLKDVLQKHVDSKLPVDMYPVIVNFSIDVIVETLTGLKSSIQIIHNKELVDAMHVVMQIFFERNMSIWKRVDILFRLSSTYQKQQKCLKIIDYYSNKLIEERKEVLLKTSTQDSEFKYSNEGNQKKKFLDNLLTGTVDGKPLSNDTIRYEMNSAIFAGYDTTASTISLMIYAFANYPDVQDKVLAELKDIYGNDRDRPVSMQDLKEMRYMELVIKEVLRFYGVVPFIGRKLTEDVNYKGTLIPKGTNLLLILFALHKSSTWYENPEEFNPDRFSSANSIKPFSYIPFSAGPRNCPGQKYALLETKITFAKLLRHFKFESAGPDYKMELLAELIMKPLNGIYVKIKSRDF